ncbi:MAG: hypothetical protein Q8S94_08355 [Pseudohongiella sp.]|nr:hypothetical protein [Pseudohongiella sp.]
MIFFCNVKYPDWASYYESQQKLDVLPILAFFDSEQIKDLAAELERLSPDEVVRRRKEIEDEFFELFDDDESESSPFDVRFMTPQEEAEYLRDTPLDQRQKDLLHSYLFFTAFVTQTFQFLALATHGKTMHELVTIAMSGDDIAFCQAIQVDRTVLFAIPYFRQRLIRMQLGNERNMLESLGRAISGKLWGNRFPNPELWITFSILNRVELLKSLSNKQILDICVRLKVLKTDDENIISKRKSEFLRRQGRTF